MFYYVQTSKEVIEAMQFGLREWETVKHQHRFSIYEKLGETFTLIGAFCLNKVNEQPPKDELLKFAPQLFSDPGFLTIAKFSHEIENKLMLSPIAA